MFRFACCVAVLVAVGFAHAADLELHIVAVQEGYRVKRDDGNWVQIAKVDVDRPGKEVVLVVSAHYSVEWEITATPKTKLLKVIFGGYHRQVVKAPFGVETDEQSVECMKQRILYKAINAPYNIDNAGFRPFVREVNDYTKLPIGSFQGAERYDPKFPFLIDVRQNDERLDPDFPKLTPAAQVPKLKFEATQAADDFGSKRTFTSFSEAGPSDTVAELPKTIRQITFDAKRKQHYGITNHELHTVDLKNETSTRIAPPNNIKRSEMYALTYDAKRDRMLISTHNGIIEYTPQNGAWTQLTKTTALGPIALVWQSKTDKLFAFGLMLDKAKGDSSSHVAPSLYELNANGTVVRHFILNSPMFPSVIGDHNANPELVDTGDELAVLISNRIDERGTGYSKFSGKRESFLYVLDPKTGKAKLAWKE